MTIKIIQQDEIGKGLTVNDDTKKLELKINDDTLEFDDDERLQVKPLQIGEGLEFDDNGVVRVVENNDNQVDVSASEKYEIVSVSDVLSIRNPVDYYGYVRFAPLLKQMQLHLRLEVTSSKGFEGHETLGYLPDSCPTPIDLFELHSVGGVDLWIDPNERKITVHSKNRQEEGTLIDFRGLIWTN